MASFGPRRNSRKVLYVIGKGRAFQEVTRYSCKVGFCAFACVAVLFSLFAQNFCVQTEAVNCQDTSSPRGSEKESQPASLILCLWEKCICNLVLAVLFVCPEFGGPSCHRCLSVCWFTKFRRRQGLCLQVVEQGSSGIRWTSGRLFVTGGGCNPAKVDVHLTVVIFCKLVS